METRTLLIKFKDGTEMQVDIQENWKVTFGPAAIGRSGDSLGKGKMPMALRIYETDKMQRAIFTDVQWFRDMSIPVRVKQVNVQEKDGHVECEGVRKRTTFRATTSEWVNPDEEDGGEKLLQMPTDTEMFGEDD